MSGRFADRVALITGASAGIGAELARQLAREGASVVVTARRTDRLEALVGEISSAGGRALAVACDVTVDGDPERAVAAAVESYGGLDVVVANAGFAVVGELDDLDLDDFRRQFETNVFGVVRTAKAGLDELVRRGGVLAVVGSVSGYLALPGTAPYSMSKAAVHSLCEALEGELGPRGVAVVQISPGFVASEIRRVDNRGTYRAERKDPVPERLVVPTEKAVSDIVDAIHRRRRIAVITGHGKAFVALKRHLPRTVRWLVRRFGISGRPEAGAG